MQSPICEDEASLLKYYIFYAPEMACLPHNSIECCGLENLFVNATYFVDSQFGNDATAIPRDETHPYQTLAAVLAIVQPGEVVFVQPGNYSIPVLNLAGSIWYFSAGATVTTLITGFGQILGFGTFIGQSPVVNFTDVIQQLIVCAQTLTTPSDFAIVASGSGRLMVKVGSLIAVSGIQVSGNVSCGLTVDEFMGDGTFIEATGTSTGRLFVTSQRVFCGTYLNSQSNSINIFTNSLNIRSTLNYAIEISDPSGSLSNSAIYNIAVGRLVCSGLLNISGLASVGDVLLQPNLNMNIQNILSSNIIANPMINALQSFTNLTYDSFAIEYHTPIPYAIVIGDNCVLHMSGARTYNANQNNGVDFGFVTISAGQFSSIRCNFIELFLTSQLLECNSGGEAQFAINNFTNISFTGRSCIVNNSQSIINVQRMLCFYSDNVNMIQNNSLMQFNIGAWQFGTNGSTIITNTDRMQVRIGLMTSDGSGNIYITTANSIFGAAIGSIRMDGQSNIAVNVEGPMLVDIGQIISNNSNNQGMLVTGRGSLYGRIGRIIMQDETCITFQSDEDSNLTFDWLTNRANAYVIQINGTGEVTLSGNSITAEEVKYPIFVTAQNSKVSLNLVRMDIARCAVGFYIDADSSDVRVNIQHFAINEDASPAGIYINRGRLTLEGNYYMRTSNIVPLIRATGDSIIRANLGFVDVEYGILESDTTGDIWYESSQSTTRSAENNMNISLPNPAQYFTVRGMLKTPGDFNINITGANNNYIRVLDAVLVSSSRNIITGSNIFLISNYSIGNNGTGGPIILAGGFTVDPNIQ